jgi:hypothetical protein
MLYLCIFTFDSSRRKDVIRRRALDGEVVPEGVEVVMEVADLTKNRVFRLCQADDPAAVMVANEAWSDLGQIETIPVVDREEIMEKMVKMKRR